MGSIKRGNWRIKRPNGNQPEQKAPDGGKSSKATGLCDGGPAQKWNDLPGGRQNWGAA